MGISLLPKRWRENELVKTECKELDSIQYSEVEEDCSTQKIGEMVKMLQEYALICDREASEILGIFSPCFYGCEVIMFLWKCGARICFSDEENYYYSNEDVYSEMMDTIDDEHLSGLFFLAWKTKYLEDFEACAKYLINLNIIPFPEERFGDISFEMYYGKSANDEYKEKTYVVKAK